MFILSQHVHQFVEDFIRTAQMNDKCTISSCSKTTLSCIQVTEIKGIVTAANTYLAMRDI